MRFQRWAGLMGILVAAAVTSAGAGTIHPRLQQEMDRSGPGTFFSVIINLQEQAPVPSLNQELRDRRATLLERHKTIVEALQSAALTSQDGLKRTLDGSLRAGTVHGYTSYWISNLVVTEATKEEIARLAARADVDVIEPNFTAQLIEPLGMASHGIDTEEAMDGPRGIGIPPGIRAIKAPEVWRNLGYTGVGRLIGSLDTGVDGNHPALNTRWRGYQGQEPWQECWLDLLGGNTQFPSDGYGHGTHTTGTMTGLGAATGDTIGVAWGAKWIACNAINQGVGSAFDNDVITAFQWFADPDGNPNTTDDVPDVVQNSWGIAEWFGQGYTDCDSRWWGVIDNCEAAGVVTCWSAGNEGPGAQTLRSPADRATTLYNAMSVGAVDATHYNWPYPIASFSSRGPTGCNVPPEQKTKPEVSAPGVDVYSSVPGGGYSQSWSGTSMAGPHVAGIVPLIREANPNIDVDSIKEILYQTARDEGNAGEDNTYGWGFVDAYAAVVMATTGFGQIEGHVSNGSYNSGPIQGAQVKLLEIGTTFNTDVDGFYSGSAPAATYHVEARHPDFRPDTVVVVLISGTPVVQDFALIDDKGPNISDVTNNVTTTATTGTYPIRAKAVDPSTVTGMKLFYRLNGNGWIEAAMTPTFGGYFQGSIPAHTAGTQIDYYVSATDGVTPANTSTSPADAPAGFYSLYVTTVFFADDVETDQGWSLSAAGDNATTGLWIRDNPVGSYTNNVMVQPEDDHTPPAGVKCFVTGNANPGQPATVNDVDFGCTTLTTPAFNLVGPSKAFAIYYRWWAEDQAPYDDEFQIDGSSNGGSTWVPLERVPNDDRQWRKVTIDLTQFLGLTNNMKFRFKACDLAQAGIVEAAVDDFQLETFTQNPADVANGGGLVVRSELAQNEPNPAGPVTMIRFRLSNPADARLEIFDASGRLVRTLVDRALTAGSHQIAWDLQDDQGHALGSGVYFYRLKAGAFEQSRRMTILK